MSDRAELRADPTDMDKAITAHTAATAALPEGSVERVTAQLNLLTARATAYDRFGGDANLDAGLTTGESILSAWPEDSLYGRMAQRKLAAVLRLRFFAHGDAEDIKRGLQLAEQAAAGSAPGSEDWLESLITVGEIRRLRYATSGSLEDLEEAIRVLEVAASTTALGPQAQARAQQAMAEMLITRFKVTGGRRDLESAIAASRWALNAFPAGLPISADASASLAEALDHLFAGDPRPEYIAESVELYEQAIQAVRRGSVKWMRWSTGLAVAISLRYQLEENVDHLERAIDYLSDVLQASSAETPGPEWAVTQLELAEVLLERHRVLMRGNGAMANGHDLDAPVAAARAALTAPVLEPSVYAWAHKILGDVYTSRFDEQHDRGDLTAAREAYGQMRSDLRELPSFHYLLIAASGIAQAQALAGDWQAAADEYGEALEIFEAIYAAQVESEGGDAWLRQLGDTYARAAYASVRAGRTDEAVLRLERGRARRLGAALEREQRDLQRVRREHPLSTRSTPMPRRRCACWARKSMTSDDPRQEPTTRSRSGVSVRPLSATSSTRSTVFEV